MGFVGHTPEDVWKEMDRRERLLGIAEKVPKKVSDHNARRTVIALESPPLAQAPLQPFVIPEAAQAAIRNP